MPGKYAHKCLEKVCDIILQECKRCKNNKFLIDFVIKSDCSSGHLSYCKECRYKNFGEQNRDKNFEFNKNHNCKIEKCKDINKFCNHCQILHSLDFLKKIKEEK